MFLPYYSYHGWGMPGASSTCGKGHEEGGLAYEQVGLSRRSPPGNSWASTPKTRVCLPSALCSHLHLWLYRGLSPTTSLWKRVNLQLQLIKFLGVTRVFQPTNSFGSPLACLNRFFWPHVIVQSLPTVRGMRCSKLSKYRFLWAVKRLIRNYRWRVFHLLGQCLLLSLHILYLLCPWQCIDWHNWCK